MTRKTDMMSMYSFFQLLILIVDMDVIVSIRVGQLYTLNIDVYPSTHLHVRGLPGNPADIR